jgi:hypothetical protein
MADLDSRPTKKRRFFTDDSPTPPESSVQDENQQPQSSDKSQDKLVDYVVPVYPQGTKARDEFEMGLEVVIGESVSDEVLDRLKRLSGGSVERGTFNPLAKCPANIQSHQHLLGRII